MSHLYSSYQVGPLLYCPANNEGILHSLTENKLGAHFSLALCLEDTIAENCVKDAEEKLLRVINDLYERAKTESFYMPMIFIRIRNAEQMKDLYARLGESCEIITGFALPKLIPENADGYISAILEINKKSATTVYIMPIFESPDLIDMRTRVDILYCLKAKLDAISHLVLNVRVGGNDLCHMFGLRRRENETIYDIRPIANILADVITVFGVDYVVSGPVWEYYNGKGWEDGFIREVKLDKLNGFIGKTVIHPQQIALLNNLMKVRRIDYEDALSLINWKDYKDSLVSGNATKERMNELKTHSRWAIKTLVLAEIYGIVD